MKSNRRFSRLQSGRGLRTGVFTLISGYNNRVEKRTGSTKIGKPIGYNGNYNVGMTHYLKTLFQLLVYEKNVRNQMMMFVDLCS